MVDFESGQGKVDSVYSHNCKRDEQIARPFFFGVFGYLIRSGALDMRLNYRLAFSNTVLIAL